MSEQIGTTFTLDFLTWTPWLERATETDISLEARERARTAIGDAPNSDYLAVLANDFEAWQARALVHRHVYTSDDPESTAWREFGATVTSRINGCVFCASVHARIYAAQSKRRDLAEMLLDQGATAEFPPIEQAIANLGVTVTTSPESLTSRELQPLRDLGFDDLAILDVINYSAFFANANRLMLTLGEPVPGKRAGE